MSKVIVLLEKQIPKLLPQTKAYYQKTQKKPKINNSENEDSNKSEGEDEISGFSSDDDDSFVSVEMFADDNIPTKEFIEKMEKLYFILKLANNEVSEILTQNQLGNIATILKGLNKNYSIMFESFVSYVSNLGMKLLYFENRDWNFKDSQNNDAKIKKLKKLLMKKKRMMQSEDVEEFMDEDEKIRHRYLRGVFQDFLYRDYGDDEEIRQRAEANRKRIEAKAQDLVKLINKEEAQDIFKNVREPAVIMEVNRIIYQKMMLNSKLNVMSMREKIAHLERYSYIRPEAPVEINRLVNDIITKVEETNIFGIRKAIPKNARKNFREAEKSLLKMMNDKCKEVAEKVLLFIFDNLPERTDGSSMTRMRDRDIESLMISSMHQGDRYAARVIKNKIRRLEAKIFASSQKMEKLVFENGELESILDKKDSEIFILQTKVSDLRHDYEVQMDNSNRLLKKISDQSIQLEDKNEEIKNLRKQAYEAMRENMYVYNQMKSLVVRTLIKVGNENVSKEAEDDIKNSINYISHEVNKVIKEVGEVDEQIRFEFKNHDLEETEEEESESLAEKKEEKSKPKKKRKRKGKKKRGIPDNPRILKNSRSLSFSPRKLRLRTSDSFTSMSGLGDLSSKRRSSKKKSSSRTSRTNRDDKNEILEEKSGEEKSSSTVDKVSKQVQKNSKTSSVIDEPLSNSVRLQTEDKSTQKMDTTFLLSRDTEENKLLTQPRIIPKKVEKSSQTIDSAELKKLNDRISTLGLNRGHFSGLFHLIQNLRYLVKKVQKDDEKKEGDANGENQEEKFDEYNLKISKSKIKISEHKPIIKYKEKIVDHIKEVKKFVYVDRTPKVVKSNRNSRRKNNDTEGEEITIYDAGTQTEPIKPNYIYYPMKEDLTKEDIRNMGKEELKKKGFLMHPMTKDEVTLLRNLREYGTLEGLLYATEHGKRHPNFDEIEFGFDQAKLKKFSGALYRSGGYLGSQLEEITGQIVDDEKGRLKKKRRKSMAKTLSRRYDKKSEIPTIPTYEKSQIKKFLGIKTAKKKIRNHFKKRKTKNRKVKSISNNHRKSDMNQDNFYSFKEQLGSVQSGDTKYKTMDNFRSARPSHLTIKSPLLQANMLSGRSNLRSDFLIKQSHKKNNRVRSSMNMLNSVRSAGSLKSPVSMKDVRRAVDLRELHKVVNILDPNVFNDKDTLVSLFKISKASSQRNNPSRITNPADISHLEGKNNVFKINGFFEFKRTLASFRDFHNKNCGKGCDHLKGFYNKIGLGIDK